MRRAIVVPLLVAGLGLLPGAQARAERPPNVIIIMPDQMRGQAMGVAGNAQVQTPNIDRLAERGVFLPNTFANNPVCCPARATILTGLYPHAHGLIINDLRLREQQVTIAEILGEAGYATGFVGKWHLDGGERMPGFVPPGPRRQGFQFWAANECNHSHFDTVYFHDTDEPVATKEFEIEAWTDEAISFIRANKDRPFFLWWACGPPHNPYKAPERFEKLYDPLKLAMRPNWKADTRFGSREDIARYYAAITAIDEQVGRFTALLDQLDLTDDTIILFTSDHGDMLGSHGSLFKCKPWEESIRIPGIITYPRHLAAGRRLDTLLSHVDFVPTLLSLCGLKAPPGLHGRDVSMELLRGTPTEKPESNDAEEAVYLQIYEPRHMTDVPGPWRGVRTRRYVYARLEDRPWLLFDLENDPYELKNLVDDPDYRDVQARLEAMVAAEMAGTQDDWSANCREHHTMYKGPARYAPPEPDRPPSAGRPTGR